MILWYTILFTVLADIHIKAEVLIDNDGGYKNIVVGIPPNFNKSEVDSLLYGLKALFHQTSGALFNASERNVYFKDIVFAFPKEYESWISKTHLQIDGNDAGSFRKPDIYITSDDIFQVPYTIQHRGCGNSGLRINIPRLFLETKADNKAFALVRQWAHYRYGVFSENGFLDDEIYPKCYKIPGSDDVKINDCTNEDANYEIEERYFSDGTSSTCNLVPTRGENGHIVSSIMTNIDFPEMRYFCDSDTRPHNRNSPNKQNALCREKSTWEVIASNEDFTIKSKNTSNVKPAFKYFLEKDPNFVVAVDTSSEMDSNDRMSMLLNAFSYFVFYDLPLNSTVRLVDMKDKEDDIVEKTILTEDDKSRLIELFPMTDAEGESCVHCRIQKLLEVLKLKVSDIIIATATDITSTWIDNIVAILKSSKVALHVIYFNKKVTDPAFLERVARSSGGTFFYIPDSFPPGFPVSSITMLYEAFRSIYESFSWMNRQSILVDQMTFTNNCKPKCLLSFPTDRTIETLQVIVTGTKFERNSPVLRKSIVLKNGIQQFVSGNDSFIYKSEIPAYVITVQNPQEAEWELVFERKAGSNTPVVAIVRGNNRNYGGIINMQAWISNNKKNIDTSDRPPITVYTEIKKHNRAISGSNVTALIHLANFNTEWPLELKDDGVGDPDITRNDGIYSRYLTDIPQPGSGYYSITVIAEKNATNQFYKPVTEKSKETRCCGSLISDHLSHEPGHFRRVITYQSFYVHEENAGLTYPPRRITDLRIDGIEILKSKDRSVKCYVLKWTAPGDDYDKGKALSYDIKVFKTREAALDNFHNGDVLTIKMLNIQGPLLEPEEVGTVQTAHVELTNLTSGTYFMAMKTASHSGKTSDVSNVVQLTYTDPDTEFTKDGYHTSAIGGTTEAIPGNDSKEPDSTNLALAIGLSCGILLLLLIIGCILFLYLGRIRKSKKKTNAAISQNSKKTESSDALCHSNGGGNISIISPVTSWDANSLVSRYETLQQQKAADSNGMLTIPKNEDTDNISLPSTKYSYDNNMEPNSLYDPVYYHQVRSQDELNYSYNPSYNGTLGPVYVSPVRRLEDSNFINNPYYSDNASYCSYSLPRNQTSRLKTDV